MFNGLYKKPLGRLPESEVNTMKQNEEELTRETLQAKSQCLSFQSSLNLGHVGLDETRLE